MRKRQSSDGAVKLEIAAFGNKGDPAAARGVTGQSAVKPILELADLIGGPLLGNLRHSFRNVAFGIVIQQVELAAKTNVDGKDDLLDGREAEELVRAQITRPVNELVGVEVDGRQPFENLLVGHVRRRRSAAHGINFARNGRSIHHLQSIELLAGRP